MLPALPTGTQSASRSVPRSSTSSNAAVFCPSSRNGFTEFTSAIGWRSASSRTSASASSKLPRSATTRAPCISAWASLPVAILPSGTMTAPVRPPRAAYAAALAAVLPVEAQITASAPSRTAADTAHVIPRSLKEPVGFVPSSLSHTSHPARSDTRSASTSGVDPSASETTGSPDANGNRSRQRSITPGLGELLIDHADRARGGADEVELADQPHGGVEARLEQRVEDEHEPSVVAQPLLDHRPDRGALHAEQLRDLSQNARPIGHLHVQVEGRLDVVHHGQ